MYISCGIIDIARQFGSFFSSIYNVFYDKCEKTNFTKTNIISTALSISEITIVD